MKILRSRVESIKEVAVFAFRLFDLSTFKPCTLREVVHMCYFKTGGGVAFMSGFTPDDKSQGFRFVGIRETVKWTNGKKEDK